jgi:hypothetical protein
MKFDLLMELFFADTNNGKKINRIKIAIQFFFVYLCFLNKFSKLMIDFKDQIKQLGDRVAKLKEQIATEEATKNAFIMPFIQSLGYDIFNPVEVVPEFISDIGTKKGEKVDYAIFKDGKPIILIGVNIGLQNLTFTTTN